MSTTTGTSKDSIESIITISYQDLLSISNNNDNNTNNTTDNDPLLKSLTDKIKKAFGNTDTSLGIIAISNIPNFTRYRQELLPLAHEIGLLSSSSSKIQELIVESSGYQVGWSHGKEKVEGDKLDLAKGSFYANPLTVGLQIHFKI